MMPENRSPRKTRPQPTKEEVILAAQAAYNEWHGYTGEELAPLSRAAAEARESGDSLKRHAVIVLDEMLDECEDGNYAAEAVHQIDWSINALGAVRGRLLGMSESGDEDSARPIIPDPRRVYDAIQEALEWFDEAPIEELEAVESTIEHNFPMKPLKEALETLQPIVLKTLE